MRGENNKNRRLVIKALAAGAIAVPVGAKLFDRCDPPRPIVLQVYARGVKPAIGGFGSIAEAMSSINDSGPCRPYVIELMPGIHDASELTLRDGVDIIRSPFSSGPVVIEHNFSGEEPASRRDIFRTTVNPPYISPVEYTPIRCKIKGVIIRGRNLNYAIHSDFNRHPNVSIEIEDCILQNGDGTGIGEYALGVGAYGGQLIRCKNTDFYGGYDPLERHEWKMQGAGWVVHNREGQTKPCKAEFINCRSLRGFYGGRIVDYGSLQNDIISIQGGRLDGVLASLLCLSSGVGNIFPSLTVTGRANISKIEIQQQMDSAGTIYKCRFPVEIHPPASA